MTGSNRRPPACKAGALPAELIPQDSNFFKPDLVGLVGLEPTTPALSRRCSNQLSYRPSKALSVDGYLKDQSFSDALFKQPISVNACSHGFL